ncbi:ABC transporter permease [Hyphomicrobium sp. MC1]|uniref:ABC transporter permease n=1 Tax=Hyphomicrobium sp. (strain MC1) TaxID=717785 RepID=UPI000213EFA2|nr:ABC transporter permease [Hyphomicrobium sp. MC1]CCB65474.1 putative ABC spermidine/putrescine transporter, inner membrane subunit [Hyphomicrobium sp. MC1]
MINTRARSMAAISPSALVWVGFFFAPIAYLFIVSFWRVRLYKIVTDASFDNYALAAGEYRHAIIFTVLLAALVGVITTVFAFAMAYMIRFRAGRFGNVLLFIALTTLFGGYLVKIYAWKGLLGSDGIINQALLNVGLISEPIYWLLYSPVAVVVTLVHFLLPYALLPINAALRGVGDAPIEAARDLGARPGRILIDVILPQCDRGILTAFALSFFVSAGDYVTPQLVGGPETFMVGNFIQSQFINRMNAPVGAALAFATMLATLLAVGVFSLTYRRLLKACST